MSGLEEEDINMQTNPAFQRLMELKNLYNITKKELGTLPADEKEKGKEKEKRHAPAPNPSTAPAASTQTVESLTTRKHKETTPEPQSIQKTIRSVILKHGGACHVDTIVEYVRSRWPNLKRRDGTPYSVSDTKKTVQTNIRLPGSSRGVEAPFIKDEDGNLLMSDEHNKDTPLSNHIAVAIDDGHSSLQAITNFILEKWPRPKDVELTDKEIVEGVSIVLKTNPKFKKDGRNCYSNVGSPSKSRFGKNKRLRSVDDEMDSDEDQKNSESDSASNNKRGGSPPPGFSCRCGATVPGKGPTCKWRKGPNGEYLCNSCGLYSKKEKKEGKRFKEKEKEKEKEVDLNPWICCDRCQKWVRAKSDGIDDISIYDDNNPDHLDYYCPACRAKEEQGKRGMKRGRGGRTVEETVTTTVEVKSEKKATRGSASITTSVTSSFTATNGSTNNERGKKRKTEEDSTSYSSNGSSSPLPSSSSSTSPTSSLTSHNSSLSSTSTSSSSHPSSSSHHSSTRLPLDSKLDAVEKELLRALEKEEELAEEMPDQDEAEKVRSNLNRIAEDLRKFKSSLVATRNLLWEKNQKDLDAAVMNLEVEKRALNERAELDLVKQLRDFYTKRLNSAK